MTVCYFCNLSKPLSKMGSKSKCKSCYYNLDRQKNPKKYKDKQEKAKILYKESMRVSRKKWEDNNLELSKKSKKDYFLKNKKECIERIELWKKKNPGKVNAIAAKRRAVKRNATPKWVNDSELHKIYENCPKGYEVDHIIPLTNEVVCGLHVPWNLQYLPKTVNRRKSNKISLSYLNNEMDNYKHLLPKDGEKE